MPKVSTYKKGHIFKKTNTTLTTQYNCDELASTVKHTLHVHFCVPGESVVQKQARACMNSAKIIGT